MYLIIGFIGILLAGGAGVYFYISKQSAAIVKLTTQNNLYKVDNLKLQDNYNNLKKEIDRLDNLLKETNKKLLLAKSENDVIIGTINVKENCTDEEYIKMANDFNRAIKRVCDKI
jgi:hypothetical protein